MTRDGGPLAENEPQAEGGSNEATSTLLKIVSPNATPEEVAALVTVRAAIGGDGPAPVRRTPPEWQSPSRTVRRTLPHGPGGWRSSGLPR